MTTTVLAPYLTQEFFDGSGAPLAGGLVFSYQAGTNTPLATYTDNTGAVQNTNPIVLNSRGESSIWIPPNVAYKFVLQDSAGNMIWTRDQVTNAQLITLFGGIDTGLPNAYVLNFAANFSAYTNGIVIYWIPANANTGPSTINVNGLGVVPIVNQGGLPLTAGQLFANQVANIMYFNGNFLLISSGYSSAAAQTLFLANRSIGAGAQALANNATTTVVFDTATTNQNAVYNTGTGLFTCSLAGVYSFTAVLLVTSNAGTPLNYGPYYISKNLQVTTGNYWPMTGQILGTTAGGQAPAASSGVFGTTATFVLQVGDTISVRCQQPNPGGGFNVVGDSKSSQFSGYRIG